MEENWGEGESKYVPKYDNEKWLSNTALKWSYPVLPGLCTRVPSLYFGASLSTTNEQPKYWNMGKASKERGTQTETQKQTHTHTHTHKIIPEEIENTFRKRKHEIKKKERQRTSI